MFDEWPQRIKTPTQTPTYTLFLSSHTPLTPPNGRSRWILKSNDFAIFSIEQKSKNDDDDDEEEEDDSDDDDDDADDDSGASDMMMTMAMVMMTMAMMIRICLCYVSGTACLAFRITSEQRVA